MWKYTRKSSSEKCTNKKVRKNRLRNSLSFHEKYLKTGAVKSW